MTSTVVADDGVVIAFDDRGDGIAVVLVHGWCSNRRDWDDVADLLVDHRRVIAIDRRGHGESTTNHRDATITHVRHASDLLAVLDVAGVERAVLVGHAGGAPGVMELARSRPDRTAGVVLVDTMLREGPVESAPDAPSALERLAAMVGAPDGDEAFAEMYRGFFARPDRPAARRAVEAAATVPREIRSAELSAIGIDTIAICRAIDAPVVWMHVGDLDPRVLSTFGDVECIRVLDSGHFVPVDAPGAVADAIDGLIDGSIDGRASS